MPISETISFGRFRLDPVARRLRYCGSERPLRAKSLAVLLYLVQHPGRLVTRDELSRAVWPGTAVSPPVLRVCIGEIRAALGDDAGMFLSTVPRQGYRFTIEPGDGITHPFVGRHGELARLHDALGRAGEGRRQVVFVAGEAGAGKTALLYRFLDEVRASGQARIGRGQCLELHGSVEPFAPLFDLLSRLCSEVGGEGIVQTMTRWAPNWLIHMPSCVDAATLADVRARVASPNAERMLRELSEIVEELTRDQPMVLLLEDLQWSDASTVDAWAHLAQRTTSARLLLIGSYRAHDRGLDHHPFKATKRSLHARGLCTEIALGPLAEEQVETYLTQRVAAPAIDTGVAPAIYRYSAGNPLFMVTMVDHLLDRNQLRSCDGAWRITGTLAGVVPDAIGELVASMLGTLRADEQRILKAGSVVGAAFSGAPVAAATGLPADTVEEVCAGLVAEGRLIGAGIEAWPDGTVSGRYEFAHALYADVLYGRLSAVARARLHRSVGERIEAGHPGRIGDVAVLLARHFNLAGDLQRAIHFHGEAARAAKGRAAPREALAHLEAALALLRTLRPVTQAHARRELSYLLHLGAMTVAAKGYTAPEVAATYRHARELAASLDVTPAQIVAVGGLYTHHLMRAELTIARELAQELLALSEQDGAPRFAVIGHSTLGYTLFQLGEFEAARRHLEQAQAAWDERVRGAGFESPLMYRGMLAHALLVLGESESAAAALRSLLDRTGEGADDPFALSQAHTLAAHFHATAGARAPARRHAERALTLATEHGFSLHRAAPLVVRGWALGDPSMIRDGLAMRREIGHHLADSLFLALLAETLLDQGAVDAALDAIAGALAFVEDTGEARHSAELHRLRGECLLRRDGGGDTQRAAASFDAALEIARQQKAKLWEQRAADALGALRRAAWSAGGSSRRRQRTITPSAAG